MLTNTRPSLMTFAFMSNFGGFSVIVKLPVIFGNLHLKLYTRNTDNILNQRIHNPVTSFYNFLRSNRAESI